ncbi:hypothetical protein HPP92_020790 [Vanilla planifolia]|uniref:Uncharacterized protein n=1 Tax=Vanilla planifolia TaxID=51239 RepID=A0A835UGI5_VANPL|nr:hypothetical protein HPP92_020790 [Vanilla planifolia]
MGRHLPISINGREPEGALLFSPSRRCYLIDQTTGNGGAEGIKMRRVAAELVPPWLEPLLTTPFFSVCSSHSDAARNERNMFCLDCGGAGVGAFCLYCRSDSHSDHRVIQVLHSSIDGYQEFLFLFSHRSVFTKSQKFAGGRRVMADSAIVLSRRGAGGRGTEGSRHWRGADLRDKQREGALPQRATAATCSRQGCIAPHM